MNAERKRLAESDARTKHWKRWGPYLSERAWGTVREDYSQYGSAWDYFPHDHARSRAYRWNEDGLAGICNRRQTVCFALALWNGKDPILKERMFGLSGPEGNHVTAAQQIETAQNTFSGGKGTEIIWLIWTKNSSDDLERVVAAAFAARGAVDPDNGSTLQGILDKYKSAPREVSKDTANQETVIKTNGDVVVHRFEIEHR